MLDNKDKKLLEILQNNSREQLTKIAREISLSIDATHKRIKKLKREGVIDNFSIFINPRVLGYELVIDVKIRLKDITQERRQEFIDFMVKYPQCTTLISATGDFDFTCVLIAKNTKDFNDLSFFIREKFKDIITDWRTGVTLECYKIENYKF